MVNCFGIFPKLNKMFISRRSSPKWKEICFPSLEGPRRIISNKISYQKEIITVQTAEIKRDMLKM